MSEDAHRITEKWLAQFTWPSTATYHAAEKGFAAGFAAGFAQGKSLAVELVKIVLESDDER